MRVRLQKQICKRRLCRTRLQRWRYATTVHQYSQTGGDHSASQRIGRSFCALSSVRSFGKQFATRDTGIVFIPGIPEGSHYGGSYKKGRALAVNTRAIMADEFFELGVVFDNQPSEHMSYQLLPIRGWQMTKQIRRHDLLSQPETSFLKSGDALFSISVCIWASSRAPFLHITVTTVILSQEPRSAKMTLIPHGLLP